MPNMLTTDDATFAGGIGNWVPLFGVPTSLSSVTTPTSPDGNNVCRMQRTGTPPGNGNVFAEIPRGIYPVGPGDQVSMEVAYSAPGSNAGTGTLFCQIGVILYPANPISAGTGVATVTSAPFTKGDGWHEVVIPEFTVPSLIGGVPPVWVGCSVRVGPWTGTGVVVGDVAYFSDVLLGLPVVGGGWGVGMVRMGAN